MFYEILDDERKKLLPKLAYFKDRFYLAGGTALALHLGHRDSEDFDFFSPDDFDDQFLIGELHGVLDGRDWQVIQDEKNTVSIIVDKKIKLSISHGQVVYHGKQLLSSSETVLVKGVTDKARVK